MRWIILGTIFLVTFVLAIFATGAMLPLGHVASKKLKLNQPPEAIWQAISNHSDDPNWRSDLKGVERLPDQNGHPAWQETYKDGMKLLLEDSETVPPQKLVRRVKDSGNMFSGQWTFEIAPVGSGGSILEITERGEVPNPFFRFVSRFIMGHTKSIEQYMTALAGKFGEKPQFEK
ncbi:MAG: Polyketide cyclase/dehydrase [Candidatus Angelobacter sp.]|nr:Polyketide cyclase/dehydrase [Candidatus Angelobacter sp.]